MEKTVYIHYGAKKFDTRIGFPIRNANMENAKLWFDAITKPQGGLWASPKNALYGWDKAITDIFGQSVDKSKSFLFTIRPNSKVALIQSLKDLKSLPSLPCLWSIIGKKLHRIDFEKCLLNGIDAIELDFSSNPAKMDDLLFGWDCDSIVILNPDIVEQIS